MSYFSVVGKLFSNVKGFYNEINAATLTGAIDAIIIQQEDGTYQSSPFHIRFGKLGVLRSKEKVVDVEVNGEAVDIQMKLGDSGEAFFVEEFEDEEESIPDYLATSPLHTDPDLMEQGLKKLKEQVDEEAQIKISGGSNNGSDKVTPEVKLQHEGEGHVVVNIENKEKVLEKQEPKSEINKRQHLDSVQSEATVRSEHSSRDADIEIKVEKDPDENVKSKRKRRRKRKNKHKPEYTNNSQTQPGEVENDDNIDDIFEIEDLSTDDELSRLTATMTNGAMSKSISLPVVEENRFDRTNEWASAHEGFSYLHSHPFSDTDLSPLCSPISSRPPTPKSDTEVDRQKSIEHQDRLMSVEGDDDTLWEWGAMPRKSITEDMSGGLDIAGSQQGTVDEKVKTGRLFNFMRKTKNVRHKPEEEGIYLDDLNLKDMDEETAKLYFPKRFSNSHFKSIQEKDEDAESGRGPSLPQSPHSVEGAVGDPSRTFLISEVKHLGMYSLSLCGGLSDPEGVTLDKFMTKVVTYDDLCENPNMVTNPDLVVRIEDKYYNWAMAAPIILSQIAFQKNLPEKTVQNLSSQHLPKKKEKKGGYSWFSWSRKTAEDVTSAPSTSSAINTTTSDSKSECDLNAPTNVDSLPSCQSSVTESPTKKQMDRLTVCGADHSSSEGDTEGSDRGETKIKFKRLAKVRRVFKKSLRLSSEQIKQLNLQPGQNEVTYSVTTQFQGTKRCHSHIYLWKHNDKIIVSDIDGTITKSDVLGQILPVMGRDWSQSGVAQLYSHIASNGYKFLYLSARAIGQSKLTKDLLQNIKQGEMTLPEGPLLLSPTSLISAFHREVIERKPEEFKISCLKDIGALFPTSALPFYAGFGNKVNDVYAYKAISIPIFRIFTINPYGDVKHELSYTFQTSYTKLTDVADHFFPPLHKIPRASAFNEVQFWREPLPQISPIEIEEVKGASSQSAQNVKSNS